MNSVLTPFYRLITMMFKLIPYFFKRETEQSDRLILRDYDNCCDEILDADLLLYRNRGVISLVGRGDYSHCGKAAWWGNELFSLEVREFYGGRAVKLRDQVARYHGKIDVFRANPGNRWSGYRRDKATEVMRSFAGCDYGYWNVIIAAATHLPILRLFFTIKNGDDLCDATRMPPFCSQACAYADRVGGGVDPVPYLSDRFTEPSDLARSVFYEYLFTLK